MDDLAHRVFVDFFERLQPGLGTLAGLVLKKLEEGHLCLDPETLDPSLPEEKLPPGILEPGPYLTHNPEEVKPFILYKGNVYFQRYFKYETNIVQKIFALIEEEQHVRQKRKELLYQHFLQEDVEQMLPALLNNFCIITGGPGTGKTTLIGKVLQILYTIDPNLKVALAAPTGKAAARMNESLSKLKSQFPQIPAASTVHRLLGAIQGSVFFKHHADNLLEHDMVVIDESSMVDGALMAKLLEAVDSTKRLVLLGDKDQLASVEAGSVFGDLCHAAFTQGSVIEDHIIHLIESHRFNKEEGIGLFSRSVLQGSTGCIKQFSDNPDPALSIDTQYNQTAFEDYVKDYLQYIKELDTAKALEKLNRVKVLCAVREGPYGVYHTNRRIEEYLEKQNGNNDVYHSLHPRYGFYHNQPVMVTANRYDLGLFNGDIGLIRYEYPPEPDKELPPLFAWFPGPDGKLLKIPPGYLTGYETVFAMTINKSQGSESDRILVLLPDCKDIPLLTRELLYTAVTRAKEQVLVQGTMEVLEKTILQKISRVSGLEARLQNKDHAGWEP